MVLSMDRWVGKVAVVTGASAGIGESIVEHLVEQGLIVAGLARRSELVEQLSKKLSNKKGKLHAVKCDLSSEEDILKAFDWIKKNLGPIHVLVNNAGFGTRCLLRNGSTQNWRDILNVNVIALSICSREAINNMVENKVDGHIININSVAGHQVLGPLMGMYTGSKFAVTALTESFRQEFNLEKLKIKVTSISPGLVETEIVVKDFQDVLSTIPYLDSSDVSSTVLYALSTPPHVQIQEITLTGMKTKNPQE